MLFLLALCISTVVAAQPNVDVDGSPSGFDTSFAKVGIIIGCTLLGLALLGLAIYGLERWVARRRAKKWGNVPKFAPLHADLDELERGRYEVHDSKSPLLLAPSPSPSASVFSSESDEAQYVEFDPYGGGRGSRTGVMARYPETPSPTPHDAEKLSSPGTPIELHPYGVPTTPVNLHLAPQPTQGWRLSRQESGSSLRSVALDVPVSLLPGGRRQLTPSRATSSTFSADGA